jgi:hypothetical protein
MVEPKETRSWLATGALALLLPCLVHAQPAPSQPACSAPQHRQFDFWIGEWKVTRPDGKLAGNSRIESMLGGCVVFESWTGADGKSRGHSFNTYARDGKWHQTWVDNGGLLLELRGGLEDGRMVMSQERTQPGGSSQLDEISWERLPSGQVQQHWRRSTDHGKTWKDVFLGIYTKTQ